MGVGAEARQAFGLQPDTTLGFGSFFGFYGRLDGFAPGLGARLSAEFVRYRTSFAGSATIGTGKARLSTIWLSTRQSVAFQP